MKNYAKVLVFAAIVALVVVPAHADTPMCELIKSMQGVFKTLRTLAFVGAAFYIASWAWTWISKGEVKKDEIQDKGMGLLVGFFVLFALGAILSAFLAMGSVENGNCIATAFN